jgi:hypothetical protein
VVLNQPFCHDDMILSRWDQPVSQPKAARLTGIIPGPRGERRVARCQCSLDIHESRGARACFRMRVSRMVHYGPHQAMSDATRSSTPIARGNTPLTIPIRTTFSTLNCVTAVEGCADPGPTRSLQLVLRNLRETPSLQELLLPSASAASLKATSGNYSPYYDRINLNLINRNLSKSTASALEQDQEPRVLILKAPETVRPCQIKLAEAIKGTR